MTLRGASRAPRRDTRPKRLPRDALRLSLRLITSNRAPRVDGDLGSWPPRRAGGVEAPHRRWQQADPTREALAKYEAFMARLLAEA